MKTRILLIFFMCLPLMTGCLGVETEAKAEVVAIDQSADYLHANGKPVGIIIDDNVNLTIEFNSSFDAAEVGVNGRIRPDTNVPLFFSELDCQGEAYIYTFFYDDYNGYKPFQLRRKKGKIYSCDSPECIHPLYCLPPNENKYYFASITSSSSGSHCSNISSAKEGYYSKVLPNDPAVTGIEEYPFPLPLTFEGMEELQMKLVIP